MTSSGMMYHFTDGFYNFPNDCGHEYRSRALYCAAENKNHCKNMMEFPCVHECAQEFWNKYFWICPQCMETDYGKRKFDEWHAEKLMQHRGEKRPEKPINFFVVNKDNV